MTNYWDNLDYPFTPKSFLPGPRSESGAAFSVTSAENQLALTGVYWNVDLLDWAGMRQRDTTQARARMQARLPELIWSTAALEGNTFTLPEVKTLLDGVTVEGKRLDEELQILALKDSFAHLDSVLSNNTFALSEQTSNEFHQLIARNEAIESGHFRGQGSALGGGNVRLTTGETVAGLPTEEIPSRFAGIVDVAADEDPRLAALIYFAAAARSQFYFDGNKRTARMMASGILMSHGYDAMVIPFERRLEYNKCLDVLFTSNDATPLMAFLLRCAE